MTVYDLEKLELAYAPPYSSAKDPVNIAGYTASNILKGDSEIFHWDEVSSIDRSKSLLLDVRDEMEVSLGAIDGAVNIPLDELRNRLNELPKDKELLVFCQVGLRGYVAYRILKQKGYKVRNLSGGYKTYQLATQKQSNEDIYEYDKITKSDDIKTVDCNGSDCKADADIKVDACGLQCPGPIMKINDSIKSMNYGEVLHIKATDPGFQEDVKSWCERTGNKLMGMSFENSSFNAYIRKDKAQENKGSVERKNDKTMVVFSNDLDKAIASFIIANGAVAMGRNVTMFFTFWGLNVLRKHDKVDVKKDLFARMFGFMMPRGSKKLKLSKMNMGGMGAKMIRHIMKNKNVASLEELVESAIANGVNLVACNMSMDVMGIKKEELIDGVKIGGVATFLGSAEESDMSLFI
jgi:peroxiredoxin family protein/TusA-related sulfurtransferase/rhodanese-related sulfurtransferase